MSIISPICGIKRKKVSMATKQNQANFKKAIFHGNRYNQLVDLSTKASDNDDEKLARKYERQQEASFDKYSEFLSQLPKAEQKKVDKIIFG